MVSLGRIIIYILWVIYIYIIHVLQFIILLVYSKNPNLRKVSICSQDNICGTPNMVILTLNFILEENMDVKLTYM